MPVRKLQLTLADRQIVMLLIGEPRDGKVDAARMVHHIQDKLDLRRGGRLLDRINRHLKEMELPALTWDDLIDPSDLVERLEEMAAKATVDDDRRELSEMRGKVEAIGSATEFSLDDGHLAWLRDLIADKDWRKPQKIRRDGQAEAEEVVPGVPAALLEVFAEVADAVTDALMSKEEGRTTDSGN